MPVHGAPRSTTLLLVPTAFEALELEALGGFEPDLARVERCGFGPITAAARAAALLAEHRPVRVLLLGIAGSYDVAITPIGTAVELDRVEIEGFDTAGFELWEGFGTGLDLRASARDEKSIQRRVLVTVMRSASSSDEAAERRTRHAGAVAEDMEGFGVALACAIEGVPLTIVRGISNGAGDRDRSRWKVRDALASGRDLALELLRRREGTPT